MKKLALLLGSLTIAASAFAGGKEVIQKPVQPVVIKEVIKEVPVYQTKTVTNGGYVEMYYRWWGKSNKDDSDRGIMTKDGKKLNQGNGNRGRLHLQGSVNLTDSDNFFFRVRDNHAIGEAGKFKDSDNTYNSGSSTQVRVRWSHKHDFWNATSRLHYQNDGEPTGFAKGEQNLEYQMRFQLAEYGFDNSFLKTTSFIIAPKVGYSWDDAHASTDYKMYNNTTSTVDTKSSKAATYYGGVDLYTYHALPLNFGFEANFYLGYYGSNHEFYGEPTDNSKSTFGAAIEAYLYNTTPLVEFGDTTLSFYFEGGFDPYKYAVEKVVKMDSYDDKGGYTNASYSLYALPGLRLDYKATDSLNFFAVAGAEMRNFHAAANETSGWLWQPEAWVGFRKSF